MKNYKIQNLSFSYRKGCFKLSMDSDILKDKFDEHAKKFDLENLGRKAKSQYIKSIKTFKDIANNPDVKGLSELELLGLINDDEIDIFSEIAISNSDYQTAFEKAKKSFFSNPENVKQLFETVLQGDTSKINYDVDGVEYEKLIKSVEVIFNDFFSQYPNLIGNLKFG